MNGIPTNFAKKYSIYTLLRSTKSSEVEFMRVFEGTGGIYIPGYIWRKVSRKAKISLNLL